MPKLSDHGLGGGGKAIGVPIYPFTMSDVFIEDENGTLVAKYGDAITTIPESSYGNSGCANSDNVYLIGVLNNSKNCYKYNVKSKQWSKIADSTSSGTWAVSKGNYIYYGDSSTNIYKYHTLNNTHSLLTGNASYMGNSGATIDGDDIYIFGGNRNSGYRIKARKVNVTSTNYSLLKDIPSEMYNHVVVNGGNGYIYLFGGQVDSTTSYKYNIANDTYTAISESPMGCYGTMGVRIDNYIYLINSAHSLYTKSIYAYDILTDTYTSLGTTPYARQYGVAGEIDGDIYMVGGGTSSTIQISGESVRIGKIASLKLLHQRLTKGCKVYTDGNINTGTVNNKIFEQETTLEKVNGVATIPADDEYFIIGGNYATIGG